MMTPDQSRPDGAALRYYQGYRYTVVTIANGAQPHTVEAELRWDRPSEKEGGRWRYFRRQASETAEDAVRRVEADFKEWVEGQLEAIES
jgi:hypothetical protein